MRYPTLLLLLTLVGHASSLAQLFEVPWMVQECQTPYAPYGSTAKTVLDAMINGGASEVSYDVADGDTTVIAKVSPRARNVFLIDAEKGLVRIEITLRYQSEHEANYQQQISMIELRKWYGRQVYYRMYDEEHVQRCGSETWVVRGKSGKKHGLLHSFQLTFERRS